MVEYVKLPKLTWTMEEGLVGKWLKKEGDQVKEGDPICEVETEKTTDVIEASTSGFITILVDEGTIVPVNQTIALIAKHGEKVPTLDELQKETGEPTRLISKVEEKEAKEDFEKEKKAVKKRIKISPLARKLADEHNLDLSVIEGSGPGGRITERDIQKTLQEISEEKAIPVKGMRETIIKRLTLSARTALPVPITTEVDATEIIKLRQTWTSKKDKGTVRLTYTDILIKAIAQALHDHPSVNSRMEKGKINLLKEINIGFAVALKKGLIVPVIHNADEKTITDIATSRKKLIEKAKRGELLTRETSRGTFTISNLGMYDIDIFAPIINPPESAILGVGRILEKPVAIDGNIEVKPMMTLCIVFDHRIMDGAVAAQFLRSLTELIKNPQLLTT